MKLRPSCGSVSTVLLAGGQGSRLHELTGQESKPAVPFAGRNRIVDFVMANVVRSGLERLLVATQFAPETLHRHLPRRWGRHFASGGMVLSNGRGLYRGTADALRCNWARIEAEGSRHVLVLAADHIYEMDYTALIRAHQASGAAVTIAADVVPRVEAQGFGVMQADGSGRVTTFVEKPRDPPAIPGQSDSALVSMGIYLFDTRWLRDRLLRQPEALDFGHELIPGAVAGGEAGALRLPAGRDGQSYWRDVGTLSALRCAHLDFLDAPPVRLPQPASAAEWSLGRGSVMMPGAVVSASARLANCIVAPGTCVPPGLMVGEDPDEDMLWFRRDGAGTSLITQAMLDRREATRPLVAPVLHRSVA